MHASATRRFTQADQALFAGLSGDTNPMHMDALAARRTQAGAPVVHGIHALLWMLDTLARDGMPIARLQHLKVQFAKFIPLDQDTAIQITRQDEAGARITVLTAGLAAVMAVLKFGPREAAEPALAQRPVPHAATPDAPELAGMAGRHGWLTAPVPAAAFAAAFPHAAAALSARTLSGLAQTSRLVGMVCPGLHSIYAGLAVTLGPPAGAEGIGFTVAKLDERFRLLELAVQGDGLAGKVSAFARHAPVALPTMAELAGHVAPDAFAGTQALVAGGSRGLSATTAMLLAAGGARVAITYASGRQDAAALREAINSARGADACTTLAYDAALPAAPQSAAAGAPNQLYYCVTPQISCRSRRRSCPPPMPGSAASMSRRSTNAARRTGSAVAFYPSSVAVALRPAGMLEYAMAKAAGEMLCAEMQATGGWHVVQSRLPRILTDQTATVAAAETADAVATLLPLIAAMHAR